MIYVDCERIEKTLSAVPGRRGPVFPTRLHLLSLYYDPVVGTRGVDGGHSGVKIWQKHETADCSQILWHRHQSSLSGDMVNFSLLFHQGFPGAGIMENKI